MTTFVSREKILHYDVVLSIKASKANHCKISPYRLPFCSRKNLAQWKNLLFSKQKTRFF